MSRKKRLRNYLWCHKNHFCAQGTLRQRRGIQARRHRCWKTDLILIVFTDLPMAAQAKMKTPWAITHTLYTAVWKFIWAPRELLFFSLSTHSLYRATRHAQASFHPYQQDNFTYAQLTVLTHIIHLYSIRTRFPPPRHSHSVTTEIHTRESIHTNKQETVAIKSIIQRLPNRMWLRLHWPRDKGENGFGWSVMEENCLKKSYAIL